LLPEAYILCNLDQFSYPEILELWERAGLHIRPEGRDSAAAFDRQMAAGIQRVIGVRLAPAEQPGGAGCLAASRLVAVVVLTQDGRKGWINRLAVDPAHRRRGLAGALLDEAERWFREEAGLEVWAALIEGDNHASQALFAHEGYARGDVVYVSKRARAGA
jgi:N-acetylglutamate synthase